MKINSINISAFGRLQDYKMDFSDGFNLIYGENENGKTTVMEFIKMMFYGSIQTSRTSLDKNARKKYLPWSGKPMAGSIDFENGGVRYRLLREFRGSNSTDKITLMNLDLGTSENLTGKSDVGYSVFGIGGAAFEKSMFIDNAVVMGSSADADGEINARLANIKDTGDEDVSLEKVIKRINSAKENLISKSGKKGRLAEAREALKQLGNELITAESTDNEREKMQQLLRAKTADAADISRQRGELFEKLKNSEKSEMKLKLLEFVKQAELYEECEKALTLTDGQKAGKEFCAEIDAALDEVTAAEIAVRQQKTAVDELTEEIATMQNSKNAQGDTDTLRREKVAIAERLREKDAALQALALSPQPTKAILNPILLILGVTLVAVGLLGGILSEMPALFIFSAVGIILLLLSLILKPNNKKALNEANNGKETLEKEIAELSGKVTELDAQINDITVRVSTNESIIAAKREEAIKRQTELLNTQNTLAALTAKLLALAGRYKPLGDIAAVRAAVGEIENNLALLERYKIAAEYAAKGTKCATLADAKEKLALLRDTPTDGGDHAKYQEDLKSLDEKKNAIATEIAEIKTELRTKFKGVRSIPEIENEMSTLKADIDEMDRYYEALLIAEDTLNSAFSELRRSFGGVVDSRALDIFARLTDNKYGSVTVSKNFDISVSDRDNFGMHSIEYLSRGATHQAYFALRLALSELLGGENTALPILLDDVFSQYDDKRLLTAFRFLGDYSKDNQVIFFTCHRDAQRIAADNGANVINM